MDAPRDNIEHSHTKIVPLNAKCHEVTLMVKFLVISVS